METLTVVLLLLVALGLAVAIGAALSRQRSETAARLRRLEAKVDQLLADAGLDADLDLASVRELVAAGETVRAVRAYRQITGASLVAANEAVDQMGEMNPGPA